MVPEIGVFPCFTRNDDAVRVDSSMGSLKVTAIEASRATLTAPSAGLTDTTSGGVKSPVVKAKVESPPSRPLPSASSMVPFKVMVYVVCSAKPASGLNAATWLVLS